MFDAATHMIRSNDGACPRAHKHIVPVVHAVTNSSIPNAFLPPLKLLKETKVPWNCTHKKRTCTWKCENRIEPTSNATVLTSLAYWGIQSLTLAMKQSDGNESIKPMKWRRTNYRPSRIHLASPNTPANLQKCAVHVRHGEIVRWTSRNRVPKATRILNDAYTAVFQSQTTKSYALRTEAKIGFHE